MRSILVLFMLNICGCNSTYWYIDYDGNKKEGRLIVGEAVQKEKLSNVVYEAYPVPFLSCRF